MGHFLIRMAQAALLSSLLIGGVLAIHEFNKPEPHASVKK